MDRLVAVRRHFDFQGLWRWLLLGGSVGVGVGLAAILFQFLLQTATQFCFETLIGLSLGGPANEGADVELIRASTYTPWLLIALPAIGGLLTALIVLRFAPEAQGHGTDAAIDAYHRKQGQIRPRVPIVKMISSVITMGTGGSGGREGPVAQIGAGIGSFIANRLHLDAKTRRLLLAAGMAAGIGAIFRAPLAAAIFACEVLYSGIELEAEALLPASVASVVSYSIFASWYGFVPIFGQVAPFHFSGPIELLPYLALALVVGFGALLYVNTFYGLTRLFKGLPLPRHLKPVLGGLLTGLVGYALYTATEDANSLSVMSTGYGVLQRILSSDAAHMSILLLLAIAGGKILTTSFTIGSGGSAGVFGPSMVIGGSLGAAVGLLMQGWWPALGLHPGAFMIVGMAGFFSAAANAPLSTIIMVSEMTGNYELLIPSLWVCTIAFLVGRRWSLYKSQVASRLDSPAHLGEYAHEILAIASARDAYKTTRKFITIPIDTPLNEVLPRVGQTSQRLFPVIEERRVVGGFRLSDLTHALTTPRDKIDQRDVRHLLDGERRIIAPGESLETALALMNATHAEELLVVDEAETESLFGILTRADILLYYSRKLSEMKLGEEEKSLPLKGASP